MKIVHVLPMLIKGGGERVAVDLANESTRLGHEVAVVAACPVAPELLRNALSPGVQVRYVSDSTGPKIARYIRMAFWTWKERSWLFEQDILHCHLTYGSLFGTLVQIWRWLLRKRGPVVVETYHAVGMAIPVFHRRIHALMAANRDGLALMAEDDYWRKFRTAHPGLIARIIPNGISVVPLDMDCRAGGGAYRKQLGIPEDCRLVVGTVGMLRPDRKPWLYIPIFAQIAKELGSQVHFVVAGGGPELGHMRDLVAQYGLEDRIHLIGLVIDPREPLSVIDLYVTLNVGGTTGLAALEAALCGLPVVAVQMLPEYTSRPDEWIWSDSDPAKVAERAIGLLRSPQARKALADRQTLFARVHHTVEAMGSAYDELYKAAMAPFLDQAK